MNIFKAIGTVIEATVNVLVKLAGTAEKAVQSIDHVADTANFYTQELRDSTEAEMKATLADLKKQLAQTE